MIVNFEFLWAEPIENAITCMHFKCDKAVCFWYSDTIAKQKKATEKCLKKYCPVSDIVFREVSKKSTSVGA
ncbi:MAG: hypothetical protein IJS80_06655 [Lachnospiraceae bacterium]|nr:hypothetical protein [Lachnospiraceae bacterium]